MPELRRLTQMPSVTRLSSGYLESKQAEARLHNYGTGHLLLAVLLTHIQWVQ